MPPFDQTMQAISTVGFPSVMAVLGLIMIARQMDFQNKLIRNLTEETAKQTAAMMQLTSQLANLEKIVAEMQNK